MLRLAFISTLALLVASSGYAAVINVPDDQPTIQAAVDVASPGDTILVHAGAYTEQVTVSKGDISIVGVAGAASTTLDADGVGHCLVVQQPGVVLEGLHLEGAQHGYGFAGYAIVSSGSGLQVRDCTIANPAGAILSHGPMTLTDSEIRDGGGVTISPGTGFWLIHGCLFEGNGEGARGATTVQVDCGWGGCFQGAEVLVENCTFINNRMEEGRAVVGYNTLSTNDNLTLTVEGNLFQGNDGPAVGLSPLEVYRERSEAPQLNLRVSGNTIVQSTHYSLGYPDPWFGLSEGIFQNNLMTGGEFGVVLPPDVSSLLFTCNDVWGNDQNWVGGDLSGINGNISLPPLYCDPLNGDFTLASNSPCLPPNNSCHVRIGSFGEGCGTVALIEQSWGQIKARYRD